MQQVMDIAQLQAPEQRKRSWVSLHARSTARCAGHLQSSPSNRIVAIGHTLRSKAEKSATMSPIADSESGWIELHPGRTQVKLSCRDSCSKLKEVIA